MAHFVPVTRRLVYAQILPFAGSELGHDLGDLTRFWVFGQKSLFFEFLRRHASVLQVRGKRYAARPFAGGHILRCTLEDKFFKPIVD